MTPKRIQMTRQRPWRHENPDAVIVARPSKWGNPYRVEQNLTRQGAVWRFRDLVEQCDHAGTPYALGFIRGAEGIFARVAAGGQFTFRDYVELAHCGIEVLP